MGNLFLAFLLITIGVVLWLASRRGWIRKGIFDTLDKIASVLSFLLALALLLWPSVTLIFSSEKNLTILKQENKSWLVVGDEITKYKVGDNLIVYHTVIRDAEIPIALLRVTAKNPSTLSVQPVLVHPQYSIIPNLRIDDQVDKLQTSELIPSNELSVGYLLEKGKVRLRPDVVLEEDATLQALEPQLIQEAIADYSPFNPPIKMHITNIGTEHVIADVELVSGEWPEAGTIVALDSLSPPVVVGTHIPTATETPTPTPTITPTPNGTQIALATPLPTSNPSFTPTTRIKNGIKQVWVPPGSFIAGDPYKIGFDDETPHQVYLDAFWIDRFLVTNAQFAECPEDKCGSPAKFVSHSRPNGYYGVRAFADYPVIEMTWQQASNYCHWRGGRLPTEAEFEKAAGWNPRTGETQIYPWGDQPPNEKLANFFGIDRDTTPVDTYPEGMSSVGAYNMAGNVWQWTADWYSETYYSDNKEWINPTGPTNGTSRVIRGGSWYSGNEDNNKSTGQKYLRVANRGKYVPNETANEIGFRCVFDK